MPDFSSPERGDEYSKMIGFFDISNIPTLANTPIDDINGSIDQMFPIIKKTESMEQQKAFKNLGPLIKSICKPHKR